MENNGVSVLSRMDPLVVATLTTLQGSSFSMKRLYLQVRMARMLCSTEKVFEEYFVFIRNVNHLMKTKHLTYPKAFIIYASEIKDSQIEPETIEIIKSCLLYLCFGNMLFERVVEKEYIEIAEKMDYNYRKKLLKFVL